MRSPCGPYLGVEDSEGKEDRTKVLLESGLSGSRLLPQHERLVGTSSSLSFSPVPLLPSRLGPTLPEASMGSCVHFSLLFCEMKFQLVLLIEKVSAEQLWTMEVDCSRFSSHL